MKSSVLRYSFLLFITIALQSCIYKDLQFKGISDYKVEEFSLKKIKIHLDVRLENPNWFGITARGGEVNIKANGVNLGNFALSESVKLKKKSDGVVGIGIETKVKNLLGGSLLSIASLFQSGGKVKLELDGYIKAKALGMRKRVKVSTTEYIGL